MRQSEGVLDSVRCVNDVEYCRVFGWMARTTARCPGAERGDLNLGCMFVISKVVRLYDRGMDIVGNWKRSRQNSVKIVACIVNG